MIFALLVIPGLLCAYALILRPLLHRIPSLAQFYSEADGFWAKVWALCGKSVTMLWGHLLAVSGIALGVLDKVAPLVGDPDLKSQVQDALQSNPKVLGFIMIGISVVTILVRFRSIGKA